MKFICNEQGIFGKKAEKKKFKYLRHKQPCFEHFAKMLHFFEKHFKIQKIYCMEIFEFTNGNWQISYC